MTRSHQRFILAAMAMVFNGAAIIGLFLVEVPEANQRIMDVALGLFLGWGGLALGYYFGTSESSAQKTELLQWKDDDDA